MQLISRCNLGQTKFQAIVECENEQLCEGLKAVIKGNLHAARYVWLKSVGWEFDDAPVETEFITQNQTSVDTPPYPLTPVLSQDIDPGLNLYLLLLLGILLKF